MLKIIPTPESRKVLYTLSSPKWEETFEIFDFSQGIYFEYSENEVIDFKFYYFLNQIAILDGPFSSQFTPQEMESFFDTWVNLDELWDWLDSEVSLKITKVLDKDDRSIQKIWKMNDFFGLDKTKYPELYSNYYEFQLSTATIRCMPYNCWSNSLKMYISDENNKIYWITLWQLKYQRQSKQLSEG